MGTRDPWHGASPVPEDVHERLNELDGVFGRHGVRLAYVFGSTARGEVGNDVDLAVLSQTPDPQELRRELRYALQTDRVHLVELSESTEFLQREVVTTGRLLFREDAEAPLRYESELGNETEAVPADQSIPLAAPERAALRGWVFQRWNGLNRQVERLWPHRMCTASDLRNSGQLRWEVERGLVIALTYVINILTALRMATNPETNRDEGPRLFSRQMSSEFAELEETRRRLHRDQQPVTADELARRLHHALEWLPVFLRETWDWLSSEERPRGER